MTIASWKLEDWTHVRHTKMKEPKGWLNRSSTLNDRRVDRVATDSKIDWFLSRSYVISPPPTQQCLTIRSLLIPHAWNLPFYWRTDMSWMCVYCPSTRYSWYEMKRDKNIVIPLLAMQYSLFVWITFSFFFLFSILPISVLLRLRVFTSFYLSWFIVYIFVRASDNSDKS